ncbi:hypothetical protein CXG81DRAFT_28515 [Caulochytrium protostelioides]|uniref:dihydroorotase n=1 Tax=Caulochytrium protostelioides TaxID=1555241 RepID=A0A4P9X201_9FUNG|nr:Dihydroorotase [Caulochytrium protostelioides]RKO98676.1 hypothetical protein CXG81DRAFT_28515 [Caulochytrium protostelioides]|eukprot:RKO98676.1 hypothetical protein CXG81DRAFT_28515 [Caulochytrium protostelioides]
MGATTLTLPPGGYDDFHVHLRQGALGTFAVKQLVASGARLAYVMPNTVPPVTTTAQALAYRDWLVAQAPAPHLRYCMTLYLSPEVTPEEIERAAAAGIVGVKSYPKGVTTNSDAGVGEYDAYFPTFAAMERLGMVLNLHGELPSNDAEGIHVMNAEERFLGHLERLHKRFPRLRIVLEHCTTAAAIQTVERLGPTVAATITVHHLSLTVNDWAGQPHNFCKPVAKTAADRDALLQAVRSGNPKFFLGTDSAPHVRARKEGPATAAGVFTGAYVMPYLAEVLSRIGALDRLVPFATAYGRAFYQLPANGADDGAARAAAPAVTLCPDPDATIPAELTFVDETGATTAVVPFAASQKMGWRLDRAV